MFHLFLQLFLTLLTGADQKQLKSNRMDNQRLDEMMKDELNMEKLPPTPTKRYHIQWYVQEALENVNKRKTRFGNSVDTIRFSNALGYPRSTERTFRVEYTFDLTALQRYSYIFGHDLYFSVPEELTARSGGTLNVSVWDGVGHLLNSSTLRPLLGNDYIINIDSLRHKTIQKRSLNLLVDMGTALDDSPELKAAPNNASIATYSHMSPASSRREKNSVRRFKRSLSKEERKHLKMSEKCCTAVPYKKDLSPMLSPTEVLMNRGTKATDFYCRYEKVCELNGIGSGCVPRSYRPLTMETLDTNNNNSIEIRRYGKALVRNCRLNFE